MERKLFLMMMSILETSTTTDNQKFLSGQETGFPRYLMLCAMSHQVLCCMTEIWRYVERLKEELTAICLTQIIMIERETSMWHSTTYCKKTSIQEIGTSLVWTYFYNPSKLQAPAPAKLPAPCCCPPDVNISNPNELK